MHLDLRWQARRVFDDFPIHVDYIGRAIRPVGKVHGPEPVVVRCDKLACLSMRSAQYPTPSSIKRLRWTRLLPTSPTTTMPYKSSPTKASRPDTNGDPGRTRKVTAWSAAPFDRPGTVPATRKRGSSSRQGSTGLDRKTSAWRAIGGDAAHARLGAASNRFRANSGLRTLPAWNMVAIGADKFIAEVVERQAVLSHRRSPLPNSVFADRKRSRGLEIYGLRGWPWQTSPPDLTAGAAGRAVGCDCRAPK